MTCEPTTGELVKALNTLYNDKRVYISSSIGLPVVKMQRLKKVVSVNGKIVSVEWEDCPDIECRIDAMESLGTSVKTFLDFQQSLKQIQNISVSGGITDELTKQIMEMAEEHRKQHSGEDKE